MNRIILGSLAVAMMGAAAGCSSYHKVTDPTTGNVYYTQKMKQNKSGSTTLTDARTGNTVTVQNSEVKKIDKTEFEQGKHTPPAAPAPAPKPTW